MSDSSTALSVINGALQLPGIKVNRREFLLDTFKVPSDKVELLLAKGPIASGLFSQVEIKKRAEEISSKRKWQTTGASALAGLPGGFAMAVAIPADTMQYFGFSLRLAQEIAYLYGHNDFFNEHNEMDDKAKGELMLYLGVMLGVSGAASAVRYLTQALAKKIATDLSKKALTKTFYYPLIKTIGAYVGVKITKDTFSRGAAKVVPLLGGLVSGGLTYLAMSSMTERLIKELDRGVIYTAAEQEVDLDTIKEEMPEIYEAIYEEIK